jgi:hypothetical protein
MRTNAPQATNGLRQLGAAGERVQFVHWTSTGQAGLLGGGDSVALPTAIGTMYQKNAGAVPVSEPEDPGSCSRRSLTLPPRRADLVRMPSVTRLCTVSRQLLLLLAATTACDPYWRLVVTAPLARPLTTDCIRSALDSVTHGPLTTVRLDSLARSGTRATIFVPGRPASYGAVWQYEYPDSTAALETQVGRVPGNHFSAAEAESLGTVMGTRLLRVRDACGGSGVTGSSPFRVQRRPL